MLDGKRLLITGVVTRDSIAYHVAERAQALGAEVVLTGFGRARRLTERAARTLPATPDVLELDVNREEDLLGAREALGTRGGGGGARGGWVPRAGCPRSPSRRRTRWVAAFSTRPPTARWRPFAPARTRS